MVQPAIQLDTDSTTSLSEAVDGGFVYDLVLVAGGCHPNGAHQPEVVACSCLPPIGTMQQAE